jgi:serine/threonine protein kinase
LQTVRQAVFAETVLVIAGQMQGNIEWVHSCGVLHRNIKPQNLLVVRGQFRNRIYLIDFGMSAPYRDQRTHQHAIDTHKHVSDTHNHAIDRQKHAIRHVQIV